MSFGVCDQTHHTIGAFSKYLVDVVAFVDVKISLFVDSVVRHVCGRSRWLRKVEGSEKVIWEAIRDKMMAE